MRRVRKKPVEVEAIQFTGENENIHECLAAAPGVIVYGETYASGIPSGGHLEIRTLEGTMVANVGDWIIRGVEGEFYPCKPDIFEQTYEMVE